MHYGYSELFSATGVSTRRPTQASFRIRLISNLLFLSALIERIVVDQLADYFKNNNLEEPLHSGYKAGYNTETALLKYRMKSS